MERSSSDVCDLLRKKLMQVGYEAQEDLYRDLELCTILKNNRIIVELDNGEVQDVITGNQPIEVEVRDYRVTDLNRQQVSQDDQGRDYVPTLWRRG
jgi:hypothetical protein